MTTLLDVPPPRDYHRVMVWGDGGVGKSCTVFRWMKDIFVDLYVRG